jgi:hypothetical protein
MEDSENFDMEWDEIQPAPRMRPIKPGNYLCSVDEVKYHKAKTGTEGVQVNFVMLDGEYRGMAVPPHLGCLGVAFCRLRLVEVFVAIGRSPVLHETPLKEPRRTPGRAESLVSLQTH